MTDVLLLNLVFFLPGAAGASAFAFCIYRLLRSGPPPAPSPGGGSNVPTRPAGPDDLARSA
jgi:hypothetical protein